MNVSDLTLGEVEEVENYAGLPLAALADPQASKGKLMVALAWVIKRKDNPSFTLHEAKQLTMEDINSLLVDDDDDPKVK